MATLTEKIEQETIKLNDLLKKRADLDRKIKKTQSSLEKYQLIRNNEKYSAIEKATKDTGISVEDVLAALQSGDLLGLQERIEAVQTSDSREGEKEGEEETPA